MARLQTNQQVRTNGKVHMAAPENLGMQWIPGKEFIMGSNDFYPEEAPPHTVRVDSFWIDKAPVTNREFEEFVKETRYKTIAERAPDPKLYPDARPEMLVPGSVVFSKPKQRVSLGDYRQWWVFQVGANWRHPEGANSSLKGRKNHPVVHVGYEDAIAYAKWAGKALPTEAQWEFAARGGLEGAAYVWGDEFSPEGKLMANTWQGEFPWQNLQEDGFEGTSPIRSFAPNGYGLYDMAGNVWEWTQDWFSPRHPDEITSPCCIPANPRGARKSQSYDPAMPRVRIPRKVLKGGSHLCAPSYCLRYRPAARSPEMIDTSTSHIGFRCVVNVAEKN